MSSTVSPTEQAAALRAKAVRLTGQQQAHCLWVAEEWERAAAKYERSGPPRDLGQDRAGLDARN